MAISVLSTIRTMTPVFNDVGFSISSTNTAQTNFKYLCDVYWAGAVAPVRKKQPAEPSNGYCYFDAAGVLGSYVTRDPATSDTYVFEHASNSYINYTIQFGEEYGASSATTAYPNLAVQSGAVWNGCFPYDEWVSAPITTYLNPASTRKFLTGHPGTAKIHHNVTTTDSYTLYFLNAQAAAYNCVIKTYNTSNTLLNTVTFGSPYTTNDKILKLGIGPANLALLVGSELRFSGTLPVINSNVYYYTVQLVDSGGTEQSKLTYFHVVESCTKYTPYRLMFLNHYGGYDFFTFNGAPKKTSEIQRSNYKKRQGSWVSNVFTYNYKDRSNTQYNTVIQDNIKLVSDWINADENKWLESLVSSPDVYYYDSTYGAWIACTITDSNFEYKTRERDTLFNLELNIQPSFNRYRQQF